MTSKSASLTAGQRDFRRDRVGGNRFNTYPRRVTYLAHGKGWVMIRHPGCAPFAVKENDWLAFPLFEPAGRAALKGDGK